MSEAMAMQQLYGALAKARAKFPAIKRSKTVSVKTRTGGSYTFSYAPLDEILATILPTLAEHGLVILQSQRDGHVLTVLAHESGESAEFAPVKLALHEGMSAQEVGSALTYAQRYSLKLALCLATEDDDDGNAASGNDAKQVNPEQISRTMVMKVSNAISDASVNDRELGVLENWDAAITFGDDFVSAVWANLTTPVRDHIRRLQNERKEKSGESAKGKLGDSVQERPQGKRLAS